MKTVFYNIGRAACDINEPIHIIEVKDCSKLLMNDLVKIVDICFTVWDSFIEVKYGKCVQNVFLQPVSNTINQMLKISSINK